MANWQLLPFYGNWLVYFPLSLDKTYDIFLTAQKSDSAGEIRGPSKSTFI